MKILKRKTLAALLALSLLASLLPLGAQPAQAAAPSGQVIYVGGENVTNGGYWTTDADGSVTSAGATKPSSGGYIHYDADTNTLTLHNAAIKKGLDYSESIQGGTYIHGSAIGVFHQNGAAELTIQLEGSNMIENVSTGIYVLASSNSTGDASLTITGDGSLNANGSQTSIGVVSNGGEATLEINSAEVKAVGGTYTSCSGVWVQAQNGSDVSLTVDGGSLTASGDTGICLLFGSSESGSGTPSLTVSGNAIVRANSGISDNSSADIQIGADSSGNTGGIVFDDGEGTVYGDVTLQDDLEIGEGESLTLAKDASLSAGSHHVIVDGGTLGESLKTSLGDSVKYAPTITTDNLSNGTVGTAYSQTLTATGSDTITWSVSNGSLPTELTLDENTGVISGTPTAANTYNFTVTATNTYGSDSEQFTLTVDAAPAVSVTGISLDKTTLSLYVGENQTLTATVKPSDAANKTVTWSSSAGSVATVDANGKVTAVGAGTAQITVTTEDGEKTATCTVTVTAKTYSLSVDKSTLNFGSITEGEERPGAQTVSVKNTGNQTVTLEQPTATNFEIGKLSETTLGPDETATFTIQPKDNLPRGSYSEQITISGNDGASATLTATFTVKEPPYTGKYSYEISTSVGDNGTLSVDRYSTEGEKVTITVTPDDAYLLDELVVTANGKEVEVTDNGDGTFSFTMPSADVRISVTFAEDPDWTEPEPEPEPATDVSAIFLDVAANAWYKDAVQYAYDNGLMTGVSATEFAPEQTTTRAMIVSMLARLEGVESAESAGFSDVTANDWYATAVNWAASVGITSGTGDGNFSPNTAITREQLAAILMNYSAYKGQDVSARADLSNYSDQPSAWATETMSWAVAEGLINGVTNDELQPQASATRAQVAAILQRFLAE